MMKGGMSWPHNIMSEYSYNYSEGNEPADFLDQSIQLTFEMMRYEAPKPATDVQPTHYTEQPMSEVFSGRQRRVLEVERQSRQRYLEVRRGRKDETMLLHPNFKTLARRHLRELIYLKLLGQKQRQNCLIFLRSSPSFANLRALLQPEAETYRLRQSLLGFFGSSAAIRQIFRSGASVQQKLMMIKFIERLRQCINNNQNGKKWKEL